MQWIKGRLDQPLSLEILLSLQGILTKGVLSEDKLGRLRKAEEPVAVIDARDGEVIYTPPKAEDLEARLESVCRFANETHSGDRFIHPLVKACILHFLIGYEHPFIDGNGRTARAVFYWYALRSGYRIFEFLTISELIRKSVAQYPQAYLDTEGDDSDISYFIGYKLRVIQMSLDRLSFYLKREEEKIHRGVMLAQSHPELNLRQRLLIQHAIRHPKTHYTIMGHSHASQISRNTARSDLDGLREQGLFSMFKSGREFVYVIVPDAVKQMASPDV
jgi:Fic family protein